MVRPAILFCSGKRLLLGPETRSRRNRSFLSLSALGLQTLLFAFSCMCCVDIPGVCFWGWFFALIQRLLRLFLFLLSCAKLTQGDVLLFFFAERKKKQKRKDLAYPCSERQCMPRLAVFSQLTRNINPPEGLNRRLLPP